ncbi:MAG: hypothetical protein KA191_05550 [Verrucomicrobia bacterium]|nr:hypothetical protein [Verrucomicrobiota bacterium]OQC63755.1 MAG: hypothetical protein BWX48_03062 [Verrucomicrobia bacterium ADurb.Bin006]MDI9381783.1 hypothetical protein [Verrucomicrobiota bacterium]NMD21842.1 hypothetical protein [Verrucomicrobiota bacterium]HNU98932.1 hypothetical protein [Verrucomicrobiota bacterium]
MPLPEVNAPPRPVESASATDLMVALSRLVRGLSALFWGLPLALVVSVQTARTNLLAGLGLLPPLLANGLLCYALHQMRHFQRSERVWQHARERALVFASINVGLSPFLYWWRVVPDVLHFQFAVLVLALSGLMLLFTVNQMLQRLTAMLPDETLRIEARLFTTLNLYLLLASALLGAGWVGLTQIEQPSLALSMMRDIATRVGVLLMLLLVLLPLALTMTLIWRIKETILASVFTSG